MMTMTRALRVLPVLMIGLSVIACGSSDNGSSDPSTSNDAVSNGGPRIGPDGLPVGPDGKPLPTKLDGKYEMSSTFDLTSAGVFPNAANETLKALSNFKEHPSQTMVDLLAAAGVPVVPTVLNAIPSFIRDYVLGYIDDHIVGSFYEAVPFAQSLTGMLDDLATITTKFEVVSTLDLPAGDGIGNAQATHAFAGVAYTWSDKRNVITAPEVLKNLETPAVAANAVALEKRSPALESARLKLGDHKFTVPIGSFAVLAADHLAKDKLGAKDLRDALGNIVDCAGVAADVANRCLEAVGVSVCVGHQSEIEQLCNDGLDTLIGTVQDQIKRLDLPAVHFKEGEAQMWDAPVDMGPLDATIDRIDHGIWTAAVNTGSQEKSIFATFTGHRVGESGSSTPTH
jgi:hypothetical protein